MHGTHLRYLMVAAGALVVGLLAAGTPVQSVLPFVLILACPLMMVLMMRGMGGHVDQGAEPGHDRKAADKAADTTADRDATAGR